MPFRSATKREIIGDILRYCHTNCTVPGCNITCSLYPHTVSWTKEADQQHLLKVGSFNEFVRLVIQTALDTGLAELSFSDIRAKATYDPLHQSWWGSVTHSANWRMYFSGTLMTTVSTSKRRRGGRSLLWMRRV